MRNWPGREGASTWRARLLRGALVLAVLVLAHAVLRAWSLSGRDVVRDRRGPTPELVEGRAVVTDGDTLRVNGRTIRLRGVDAPELRQTCRTAEGRPYACGEAARAALARLAEGRNLACRIHGRDRYRRMLGRCSAGGEDVGESLVRSGLALAYLARDYAAAEEEARRLRRGLWAGSFQPPAEWRRARRERPPG